MREREIETRNLYTDSNIYFPRTSDESLWRSALRTLGGALLVGAFVGLVIPVMLATLTMPKPKKQAFPDFRAYQQAVERKEAFISYLLPHVYKANAKIYRDQNRLIRIYQERQEGLEMNEEDMIWATQLAKDYKLKRLFFTEFDNAKESRLAWQEAFRKVDMVPASLVLAQAANESGWGTSRFAREGKNLFGEWCFTKGCGIVPLKRGKGRTHEVRAFDSVYDSVEAYMHNLNTNRAYRDFRERRVRMRLKGEGLDSIQLAEGLLRYSELGRKYVDIIHSVIDKNGLQQFDSIHSAEEKDDSKLSS